MIMGIGLVTLIAVLATVMHVLSFWPFTVGDTHPIEAIIIAMLVGMFINSIFSIPDRLKPGIKFCNNVILQIAIVLLGAKLSFMEVARVSGHALIISVIGVLLILILAYWLIRLFNIERKTGILIGIGTAICGGSAIIVASPIIKANETETALSIAVITLFGTLAIFLYPLLGHALQLDQTAFGTFAGISIPAVPQVIAAAFLYGPQAGKIGTIVKLVRILLLVPVVIGLSYWQSGAFTANNIKFKWTTCCPPMIIGFIFMAMMNSFGAFPRPVATGLDHLSSFLITMAMAAIGLGTEFKKLIATGSKPLFIGFLLIAILAIFGVSCMLW